MICKNCGKAIRLSTGAPYCGCRFYNSKILKYFIVETTKMKLTVRRPLWVVSQGGVVGLLADGLEITLTKQNCRVYVSANGERLGAAEFITLPPFVEKLLSSPHNLRLRKQVTVIARRKEAMNILSSTPGATLRAVEGGKAVITIPV
jgi:hypothetical protein